MNLPSLPENPYANLGPVSLLNWEKQMREEQLLVSLSESAALRASLSAIKLPPPAVPVEERTAMPTREAVEKALGAQDYPTLSIKYVLNQLTEGERRILFRAVIDAAKPIPEERTAEMEELGPAIIEAVGALRSSYNVQDFPGDGDTRQDHAANALERIWDHIEGKVSR